MRIQLSLLFIVIVNIAAAQLPHVSSGKLARFENFRSAYIDPRNVDVWLPDGYSPKKKYDVLYMHDGQMLFDSATTWNKQEWGVDEVAGAMMKKGLLREFIVVAIWNTGKRWQEYCPANAYDLLSQPLKDTLHADLGDTTRPVSDNYLLFLIKELKPFIDSVYSTNRSRPHTFIAGSSMGGLISLYAICEYPDVFGGAACLSTHWPVSIKRNEPAFAAAVFSYMQKHLPDPGSHRIYFDLGDKTLDSWYSDYQLQADSVMKAKGFTVQNWITRTFPGADHSERSWHARFRTPLLFLLGRK